MSQDAVADAVPIFLELCNGTPILKLAFQRLLENRDIIENLHLDLRIWESLLKLSEFIFLICKIKGLD